MKKKIEKRFSLNKATVTDLNRDEMKKIIGATLLVPSCVCSVKSCSLIRYCCPPTEALAALHESADCL